MKLPILKGVISSATVPLPTTGLVSQLDGSIATSFFSDLSKTTNSTEGGSVAVWADQSGLGNDWTQPTGSAQPVAQLAAGRLYNAGDAQSTPNKYLIGPNISAWTEGSFFCRMEAVTSTTAGAIWGNTSWSNVSSVGHWNWAGTTHYACFGTNSRPATSAITFGGICNYEESITAARYMRVYQNGSSKYAATTGSVLGFRTAPYLGCGVRGNVASYAGDFHIYKFLAYSRVITDTGERAAIYDWLNA